MKYLEEFRDLERVSKLLQQIKKITNRQYSLMEICGGQTHSILKYGIDQLLSPEISLIHGPGCPICVTPLEMIEKAQHLATKENVILCSFGDMMRVPGQSKDLLQLKSEGADIRSVYSPLDVVAIAQQHPDKEIVFFAVGFETTAPANAAAVLQAAALGLTNYTLLVSHVLVPPAMEAILSSAQKRIDGFLAAGHVCTIMGCEQYYPLADKYQVPIVVTGFEPVDILHGILLCVEQLEAGEHRVINQYSRSVRERGNADAIAMIKQVFEIVPQQWRGIGEIPASGFALKPAYQRFDANLRFNLEEMRIAESTECISGEILQGLKKPPQCPAFAKRCNPQNPLGAPMVSSEGACAAYYHYNGNVHENEETNIAQTNH